MTDYKLVTYQATSGPHAGFIVDDRLYDLA